MTSFLANSQRDNFRIRTITAGVSLSNQTMNSSDLSDWLRIEKSVFIVAGDVYGLDNHFRIGIGAKKKDLLKGYEILTEALREKFGI